MCNKHLSFFENLNAYDFNMRFTYGLRIAAYIVLFLFFVMVLMYALHILPSFDGSMNLQVPVSLLQFGKYATSYPEFTVFAHRIQSGFPLLYPIYVVFEWFGIGAFQSQIISALYLFSASVMVYLFVKHVAGVSYALFALVLFIATPKLTVYGLNVYGELPMLFFLLLGFFIFQLSLNYSKWPQEGLFFLFGIVYSLAYLTKTVALIALPSIGFVFILGLWFKRFNFQTVLFFIAGGALPLLLFEYYKYTQIGGEEYLLWWKAEAGGILMQAGVNGGFHDTVSLFEKITIHFQILSKDLGIHLFLLIFTLVLPYVILLFYIIDKVSNNSLDTISLPIILIAGIAITYSVWWIGVTPTQKAWFRRIIVGVIIHEILLIVMLSFLKELLSKYKYGSKLFILSMLILVTPMTAYGIKGLMNHTFYTKDSGDKVNAMYLAEKVRALPEGTIVCGFGWWQAPKISFLSQSEFCDFKREYVSSNKLAENDYFIVIDPQAHYLGKGDFISIKSKYRLDLKEQFGNYYLYKVKGVIKWPIIENISESEKLSSKHFIDYSIADYALTKGIYSREDGRYSWSSPGAYFFLKNQTNSQLLLQLYIPKNKVGQSIQVYIDKKFIDTVRIDRDGVFSKIISIPKSIENKKYLNLWLVSDINIDTDRVDPRALAFVISKIGLIHKEN